MSRRVPRAADRRRGTVVRFSVQRRDLQSGQPEGLFTVAYRESMNRDLPAYQRDRLEDLIAWFKTNVRIPSQLVGEENKRAICWFRASARKVISKAWELTSLLKEVGYDVELHRTDQPGIVVYEDGHQVAAKPLRTGRRYFKRAMAEGKYDEHQKRQRDLRS
jgi:hypothetical protein